MAKSTRRKRGTKKNRGRFKPTGTGIPTMVRWQPDKLAAIDGWISDTPISRPEAIRQLVSWALENVGKKEPVEQPLNIVRRARENEAQRAS